MYIDQDLVVVNVKAAMNDSVNHCACLLWFVVQRLLIGDYGLKVLSENPSCLRTFDRLCINGTA